MDKARREFVVKSLLEDTAVEWHDSRGVTRTVTLTWAMVDGSAECVGFAVSAPTRGEPVPITASNLREMKIAEIVKSGKRQRLEELGGRYLELSDDDLDHLGVHPSLLESVRLEVEPFAHRALGRPKVHATPDLREVGRVYSGAVRFGEAPRKAVAAHLHVSDSQASRYIKSARDEGHLPPTTPGRAKPAPLRVSQDDAP